MPRPEPRSTTDWLRFLSALPGVPGHEAPAADAIAKAFSIHADRVERDRDPLFRELKRMKADIQPVEPDRDDLEPGRQLAPGALTPERTIRVRECPVTAVCRGTVGVDETLEVFHSNGEIVFDEPDLLPFAKRLIQSTEFRAETACTWTDGPDALPWSRVEELLTALIACGFLQMMPRPPVAP